MITQTSYNITWYFVVLRFGCWYCVLLRNYKFILVQFLFQLTGSAGNWNSNVKTENVSDLALCVTVPRTARMVLTNLSVVQVSNLWCDLQVVTDFSVLFVGFARISYGR